MNIDNSKENILPLACGRDIRRLEQALNADSAAGGSHEELEKERM